MHRSNKLEKDTTAKPLTKRSISTRTVKAAPKHGNVKQKEIKKAVATVKLSRTIMSKD